jgi:hypothetical protein
MGRKKPGFLGPDQSTSQSKAAQALLRRSAESGISRGGQGALRGRFSLASGVRDPENDAHDALVLPGGLLCYDRHQDGGERGIVWSGA